MVAVPSEVSKYMGNAKKVSDIWGKIIVNVKESPFLAIGDGVTDDTASLQAARDYIASLDQPCTVVFPAGIYKYSVSPNWGIQNVQIEAMGEVRLRYTGTEDAVVIMGGSVGTYNVSFGRSGGFIIECPATAKNGIKVAIMHHGYVAARVMGAGAAYAGFRVEGCVCSVFDVVVSNNEEGGFYQGAKPGIGLMCTAYIGGVTVPTSYCTFINPILEGVPFGANLDNALGNTFISGTMEGCSVMGMYIGPNGRYNKIYNVDFEANTDSDITCDGFNNNFFGVDCELLLAFDGNSKNNKVFGGNFTQINLASGAEANLITGVNYNRSNTGKTILDLGTKTRLSDNYNVGIARQENRPPLRSTISPTGSPFTYTNNNGNNEKIMIAGGTVSQTLYIHAGVGDVTPTPLGVYTLAPTDSLIITYTVAPTITKYST